MKTRMLKWFDVFTVILFAIPDLIAIGVARWRAEAAKHSDSDLTADTNALTDAQLEQVFTLIGIAIVVGGMKEEDATEYAFKAVVKGAGESTTILEIRERAELGAVVAGTNEPITINLTPDLTFDAYIAQIRSAGGLPMYEHAPKKIRDMHKRDLDHIKAHVYEEFESFASDAPELEQANVVWQETEVEDVGKSDDYHRKGGKDNLSDILGEALGQAMSETIQEMKMRGHGRIIH